MVLVIAMPLAVWFVRGFHLGPLRDNVGPYLRLFASTVGAVSIFGSVAGFGWLCATNAWLDDSAPTERRVLVEGRIGGKGPRRLKVDSWLHAGETEKVHVPRVVYDANPSFVIVTTRAGFFGFEWVDTVAVPPAP